MDGHVQRIPYPDPQKIAALPGEAQGILNFVEGKLPKNMFKTLQHEFVAIAEGSAGPIMSEKTVYGGALQYTSLIYRDLGAYNPDQIPIDIYDKMTKDPTIALGVSVIKYTLLGLNWRIECNDDIQRRFLTKAIKKIFKRLVFDLADAVRLGVAVGEKIWDEQQVRIFDDQSSNATSKKKKLLYDELSFVLDKVKFIHPRTVRMRIDVKGNFLGINQQSPQMGNIIKVNPNKLVTYAHNMHFGNYFGESRLKNCYPAWYWSQVLTQFMLKYYERRGQPLTVMRAPQGFSTDVTGQRVDNLAHALKVGQAAISNSVVSLPSSFDKTSGKYTWDLDVKTDDQRGEMFIQILNYMNSQKLRGLFIPDKMGLASDGANHPSGGSSAGDTLDVFIMTEQALASDIEDVIDEQIIKDLQQFNFSPDEIEEASIKIEKLDYSKKLLLKDVFLRMIMLAGSSVREGRMPKDLPSINRIAKMLELPVDKFDDMFEEIVIASPASPDPTNPINDQANPDNNVPPTGENPKNGGKKKNNIQNNPMPTIAKKSVQDKNNLDKSPRKERSSRERSIREKKK